MKYIFLILKEENPISVFNDKDKSVVKELKTGEKCLFFAHKNSFKRALCG